MITAVLRDTIKGTLHIIVATLTANNCDVANKTNKDSEDHLKLNTYSVWLLCRIPNVKIRDTYDYHCPLEDLSFGINFLDFDLYLFTEVIFVITTDRDLQSRAHRALLESCPVGSLLDSLQHLLLTTAIKCADSQ